MKTSDFCATAASYEGLYPTGSGTRVVVLWFWRIPSREASRTATTTAASRQYKYQVWHRFGSAPARYINTNTSTTAVEYDL